MEIRAIIGGLQISLYTASLVTDDGEETIQLTIAFVFFVSSCTRTGGAFDGIVEEKTPFGYKRGEGIDAGYGEVDWICARDRDRTDPIFMTLNPIDGKITGESKWPT